MKQTIRLILALLLFLCLADMPYGYYNFVRFVAAFAFAYFAFEYYKKEREGLAFAFGALALMFQPFIKLALGRVMWNVVDVVVGLGLVYLAYLEFKKKD
ncbi:MAG: hypothetical protein IJE12_09490 [Prevotella sp.]|nr:hypothetical protein [Prevotella sp.]